MKGVVAGYGGQRVLNGLTLQVSQGEFFGLCGGNGEGKSTLLRVLLGLIRPGAGRVRVLGEAVTSSVRRRIGYVAQHMEPGRLSVSVLDFVVAGRWGQTTWGLFGPSRADLVLGHKALEEVGLSGCERDDLAALSGGQKQRVRLAAAMVRRPELLLLDEPATHLDTSALDELMALLKRMRDRRDVTVVMVSHDFESLAGLADRVMKVSGGRVWPV